MPAPIRRLSPVLVVVGLLCAPAGCKGTTDAEGQPRSPTPAKATPTPTPTPVGLAAAPGADPAAPATPEGANTNAAAAEPPKAQEEDPPARTAIELTFVGDIIFGRYREDGYDPIPDADYDPFADIAEQLKADVVVANLETPLADEIPQKSPIASKYRFGASKAMAQKLADAGFTAVSLANNHAFDMRAPGMKDTPRILEEIGVVPLGRSREEEPIFRVEAVEKNGWKLGFVAVTSRRNAPHREGAPTLPFLRTRDLEPTLKPVIEAGRKDHDAIIVLIHWGDEYANSPARIQRTQAQKLIDAGADMVIGHHPHVLQGIERHGDGVIAYSMGNFLFENTTAIPRLTGVLRVGITPSKEGAARPSCVEKVVFHPAYIKRTPTKHPVPATDGMGKRVRRRMVDLSAELESTLVQEGEDLVMQGWSCG